MLSTMEKQRAAEEAKIDDVRGEEERKEAVVLAHKKAEALEAAVLSVQVGFPHLAFCLEQNQLVFPVTRR